MGLADKLFIVVTRFTLF
jgi:hypothetical protein